MVPLQETSDNSHRGALQSLIRNVLCYGAVRGVQYVHWVMHKCIMVKVGGEIHVKYAKSR